MRNLIQKKTQMVKKKLSGQFFMTLISLSVPIIIQNFMAAGLNLVDNIMVGQLSDTLLSSVGLFNVPELSSDKPLAAVGLANQVYFIFYLFLVGVSGGASMFISQFWGKKDIKNIRRILGLSLILAVSVSIIIIAVTAGFPRAIMSIMSKDIDVIELGTKYLRISAFSYILYAVSTIFAVSMRSVGHAKPPMIANIVGILLNSTLNYALIFGNFGFPEMGVTGAAIATVIARFIEMVIIIIIVYSHSWPSTAKFHEMIDLNKGLVKRFFSQSGLLIFKDVIWALGISIYMVIYSRMDTDNIAAVNIVQAVHTLSMVFFVGLANACQIMIGNLLGAGHNERAQIYGFRFFVISFISSVITGSILILCRNYILIPYNVSGQVANNAIDMILVSALFMPFTMTNLLFVIGVMRSSGDTFICIIMDLIAIYLIGMPLILLGAFRWELSVVIIFALVRSQEIFKTILLLIRFFTRKWIKNIVHNLE